MNDWRSEERGSCFLHPKEANTGVCPLCLNERLLVLAAKQEANKKQQLFSFQISQYSTLRKPSSSSSSISLPKIFSFGSLLNRFEFHHNKPYHHTYDDSPSAEDSFISIKFEDNGVASWDKGTVSKVSLDHCNNISWSNKKSVVEHVRPRGSSLRWRKRIGHMFQLNRWRRSSKASGCHAGSKLEGAKVVRSSSSGWIRTLTKRKTKE
ncbi:uncharacterized protein LOC127800105 [Diospyros lotus]|uniref:uncharacterized protein LOC127800105 n=1 Tax=Diospyros lotus TaxID=55363 RepID=UPI00224EB613|nr:uncharacterized protein LOC127800105 [Diospyros lotus]